jgi:hypothetical protein
METVLVVVVLGLVGYLIALRNPSNLLWDAVALAVIALTAWLWRLFAED